MAANDLVEDVGLADEDELLKREEEQAVAPVRRGERASV